MQRLTDHPNYTADDADYLRGKGWTPQQILARWDEELAQGNAPTRWDGFWAQSKLRAVTC